MASVTTLGSPKAQVRPSAIWHLKATPETIHWGYFSPDIKPALTIKSGDLVHAEAITHHAGDAPELMFDEGVERIFREVDPASRAPGVHIMTGPIYIEGAEPGDMIEVRYLQMVPRNNYGSNLAANWGHLYEEFGKQERVTIYELDPNANTAHALYAYDFKGDYLVPGTITNCPVCDRQPALPGITIPARPHLGTAGVAPAVNEPVSTIPPGLHGGNIDNWRIGAGSTMFYKCQVKGGLFSIGDPHVSQGDGEISGTAIEASLDCLFQIILRKDFDFPSPLLETPENWIVHGFGEDLDQAMKNCSMDMLHLLHDKQGLSKNDAYSLMSVAADFGITQVVDGTLGVHARIERRIFPGKGTVIDPPRIEPE
ncbi:acetamidase/formamidase family protein [Novosphingobium sp. AP12]|uniref:acetamidase/formamidase family protein n=1 Tax=Novosphingobium sp. AP12 TaxID=1144305 RepID=UPI0002720A88|nr:acetamidase/formamidase family protein [Novosphingobium sp. AP12]EJL32575.1 putative acetamidase/formamidase [Novosphingobium sp. AP12]